MKTLLFLAPLSPAGEGTCRPHAGKAHISISFSNRNALNEDALV
ncbi:hypothetical protein P353_19840 [Comamonas testosteroni]|uniref:Uncharacterized protein n=1 Tax=Comamonas testosteroni TaxID=285 RepID=A0A096FBG7_COMTE|nr:hypothetical protein P353_19840 [Comamonas testosteroni]